MYETNTRDKYEYFCYTLNNCGMFLLKCSEDDVGYYIFEELDSLFRSFLCEQNLKELLQEGYIDQHVVELSRELRQKLENISDSPLWELEYVTTAPEWLEILKLSDEIKDYQKKSSVGYYYLNYKE